MDLKPLCANVGVSKWPIGNRLSRGTRRNTKFLNHKVLKLKLHQFKLRLIELKLRLRRAAIGKCVWGRVR